MKANSTPVQAELSALETKIVEKGKGKEDRKPRIKREAGAAVDLTQPRKKLKVEGPSSCARPFIFGEVIDLT
jgi:hypothetical protein